MEQMLAGGATKESPAQLSDVLHPEERAKCEDLLRQLFHGGRESFQIESLCGGAKPVPTLWSAWRVPENQGEPESVLVLAESAPGNVQARERVRRAEKLEAVGRLAGGVAHDFSNILTGVLLNCDLLLSSLEPGHRGQKYAEEIRNAGMQATGLVRQLLAMARPASSVPRLLSLNEVADGMQGLLTRLIGENIELKLQLDPNLGAVQMDPTQAQQILLNLVLNARDAMPGGGVIAIETTNCNVQILTEQFLGGDVRTGGATSEPPSADRPTSPDRPRSPDLPMRAALLPCALLVVRDNGGGMDAATRAHVFEAFFTTKAAGKGNGLGLSTVHEIVTGNGGLIHVDSAPDCGTRISVLLPLIPESAQESDKQEPKKIEGAFQHEKRNKP